MRSSVRGRNSNVCLSNSLRIVEDESAACDMEKTGDSARQYKKTNPQLFEAWIEKGFEEIRLSAPEKPEHPRDLPTRVQR